MSVPIVFGAVRALYGVRVEDAFVVYDSHCVDVSDRADMCLSITGADPWNASELTTALETGHGYGRQVLRARVDCGGFSISEVTVYGDAEDLALIREALIEFSNTSTDNRELAVFGALYQYVLHEQESVTTALDATDYSVLQRFWDFLTRYRPPRRPVEFATVDTTKE
ncbi:hypothetical protein AB0L82_43240 [Nocardia sp. NPDC052001]|uniref:hypothetical protein n=1 Tax=Nocardia sp. NPDC052001 TaxID=3154853 RepID=UPI003411FF0C